MNLASLMLENDFDLSFPVGVPQFEKGKIGKALAITVREGVCICGGSQASLEITDSEFSILAWVRMPKQNKSIEVTMEGWQANGPMIGSVSLVVDNGHLIGRILKG